MIMTLYGFVDLDTALTGDAEPDKKKTSCIDVLLCFLFRVSVHMQPSKKCCALAQFLALTTKYIPFLLCSTRQTVHYRKRHLPGPKVAIKIFKKRGMF